MRIQGPFLLDCLFDCMANASQNWQYPGGPTGPGPPSTPRRPKYKIYLEKTENIKSAQICINWQFKTLNTEIY